MNKDIPEIVKSYLDYLTVIKGRAKSTTYWDTATIRVKTGHFPFYVIIEYFLLESTLP
jgi:hypothetical protein